MAESKYVGRISNNGASTVKAPVAPQGKKSTVTATHGNDLRSGNTGGKGK